MYEILDRSDSIVDHMIIIDWLIWPLSEKLLRNSSKHATNYWNLEQLFRIDPSWFLFIQRLHLKRVAKFSTSLMKPVVCPRRCNWPREEENESKASMLQRNSFIYHWRSRKRNEKLIKIKEMIGNEKKRIDGYDDNGEITPNII